MKTASKAQKFKPMPHVSWRRVEEESVLLNVDTSEYYSLDPVGTLIWERLGKGETLDEVAADLAKEFGISKERAAKDAHEFVSDLLKESLLHKAD